MQNIHYIHNAKHSLYIHKVEFTNAYRKTHKVLSVPLKIMFVNFATKTR